MLIKEKSQKVRNDHLGYVVQVHDRFHVDYVENAREARVTVDFGNPVVIYVVSLHSWVKDGVSEMMTEEEKKLVLFRIEEALQFMGSATEIEYSETSAQ